MMTVFLTYELKVAFLVAVFYIFWRLLIANETWHRLNRVVLLSTAVASFVLPLCIITIHQTVEVRETMTAVLPMEMEVIPSDAPSVATIPINERTFDWSLLLSVIYIIGLLVVLSKMILSIWRLHHLTVKNEIRPLSDGQQIVICEEAKTPFSWWKTVFMNKHDYEKGTTALLTHELEHLRLHHSADVLLVELLTALQWFNPAMWMLRADLRTIHEYEADQQVLSHGFNDIQYLHLLIRKAAVRSGYSLANGISNSALKKRVTMIMKPKSKRNNMLKLLVFVPIVCVALALNAETVTDMVYKNDTPRKQLPIKKGKKKATIKIGSNQAIQVVEQDTVVKDEAVENQQNEPNAAVLILNTKQKGEEPLLIVDDKIASIEQVRAIPRDSVASITVMKDKAAIKSFGEIAKNGVLIITTVKHQKEIDNEPMQPDVFDEVDEMPQFPGGMAGMMQYLSNNVRYPKDAREAGTQGRVIVSFIVEKDGSISNARVTKPTFSSLDEEALRVVSTMPKFKPGKQYGEPVRVKYSIPVTFRLNSKETPKVEGTATPNIKGTATPTARGTFTPTATGTFTPTAKGTFTPTATGTFTPTEIVEKMTRIDEDGRFIINGKEVKRFMINSGDELAIAIMNIMLNDTEYFDYVIDGTPVPVKDLQEKSSPLNIKSIEFVQKDSKHPKARLLITTKKAE